MAGFGFRSDPGSAERARKKQRGLLEQTENKQQGAFEFMPPTTGEPSTGFDAAEESFMGMPKGGLGPAPVTGELTKEDVQSDSEYDFFGDSPAPQEQSEETVTEDEADKPEDDVRREAVFSELQKDRAAIAEEGRNVDPELAQALTDAQAIYRQSKADEASKQLWSTIAQGVAHIVAGAVGLRTGLNLGGLKFNQTDWERRREGLLRELQTAQNSAFQQADSKRQRLMEKSRAAMDEFSISKAELDAARQAARDADIKDTKQRETAVKEYKAQTDRIKALSKSPDSEVDLANYKRELGNLDQAMNAFSKEENNNNLKAVQTAAVAAKKYADKLGIQSPITDPAALTAEEPGRFFGTNEADFETVSDRLQQQISDIGETGGPKRDPQIEQYAKQFNMTYEEAEAIINKRRGN